MNCRRNSVLAGSFRVAACTSAQLGRMEAYNCFLTQTTYAAVSRTGGLSSAVGFLVVGCMFTEMHGRRKVRVLRCAVNSYVHWTRRCTKLTVKTLFSVDNFVRSKYTLKHAGMEIPGSWDYVRSSRPRSLGLTHATTEITERSKEAIRSKS